jgi:hypothetical protein
LPVRDHRRDDEPGSHPPARLPGRRPYANIDPGQIINIAGDDWYFFPWIRKQFLQNDTEESWNAGVAYRRENT